MNVLRTGMLLAAMTALFLITGYLIGGGVGAVVALVFALATNAYAYWNSDRLALASHNAQPVSPMSHPDLHKMVARLAKRADLPMPKVYLIDARQANAFATGRDPANAAVAATTGLLHTLNSDEVEGVMAHELAHIKNRDTLIMTVTATIAGAISFLANIGFFLGGNRDRGKFGVVGILVAMVLAPLAAALIQMAVSRTREYAADRTGAEISGNPLALASALDRIRVSARHVTMPSAETHPNSAHMFVINPLRGRRLNALFSTHPPAEKRIAALRALAAEGRYEEPAPVPLKARLSSIPRVRRR